MIRCAACENIGDCKDEWIEGIFEDAAPYRFFCPTCIEYQDPAAMAVIREQDPVLYKELTDGA